MAIKLVIADDAPFIREVIKQIANDNHIDVVGEASNGNEVIKVVRKTSPDVVLMDLVMPEKNGVDATAELIAEFPQLKIVVCTTVDQEGVILKALKAGACDFVTKPFSTEKLLSVINKSMGYGQESTL